MRRPLRDIAEEKGLGDVTTLAIPPVMGEIQKKVADANTPEA
jgi:hypothetical protein